MLQSLNGKHLCLTVSPYSRSHLAPRAAFCTYTPWLVITEIQDPAGVSLDKTPWQHFLETAWGQSNRKPATTPSLTANIVGTDNILFPWCYIKEALYMYVKNGSVVQMKMTKQRWRCFQCRHATSMANCAVQRRRLIGDRTPPAARQSSRSSKAQFSPRYAHNKILATTFNI